MILGVIAINMLKNRIRTKIGAVRRAMGAHSRKNARSDFARIKTFRCDE